MNCSYLSGEESGYGFRGLPQVGKRFNKEYNAQKDGQGLAPKLESDGKSKGSRRGGGEHKKPHFANSTGEGGWGGNEIRGEAEGDVKAECGKGEGTKGGEKNKRGRGKGKIGGAEKE